MVLVTSKLFRWATLVGGLSWMCAAAHGQGVGFPSAAPPSGAGWTAPPAGAPMPGGAAPSTFGAAPSYAPPTGYGAPANYGAPAATLAPGIQPFDPYAMPSGDPMLPPPLGAAAPYGAPITNPPTVLPPPGATSPWPNPGTAPTPYTPYPTAPSATPYGGNPATWGSQPGTPYFPNGFDPTKMGLPPYERLFQDTGVTYYWLYGSGDGNSLMINDIDISTTAVFPNFLGGTGPLRVRPGFTFTLLDGPSYPVMIDLPGALYSAYLDFTWSPWFTPQLGAEFGAKLGVFSDFTTVTSDSIRVPSLAAGVVRLTPSTSFKLGVAYIDRNSVKLLPVAGIVWDPSPQKHWEIVFPSPKLACYATTTGNTQVWWYVGAEYGGGAWTYDRVDDGSSDRVDINDIRVFVGVDWFNLNRCHSFAEVGYVFNREIVDVLVPDDSTDLEDTVMIRAGIHF